MKNFANGDAEFETILRDAEACHGKLTKAFDLFQSLSSYKVAEEFSASTCLQAVASLRGDGVALHTTWGLIVLFVHAWHKLEKGDIAAVVPPFGGDEPSGPLAKELWLEKLVKDEEPHEHNSLRKTFYQGWAVSFCQRELEKDEDFVGALVAAQDFHAQWARLVKLEDFPFQTHFGTIINFDPASKVQVDEAIISSLQTAVSELQYVNKGIIFKGSSKEKDKVVTTMGMKLNKLATGAIATWKADQSFLVELQGVSRSLTSAPKPTMTRMVQTLITTTAWATNWSTCSTKLADVKKSSSASFQQRHAHTILACSNQMEEWENMTYQGFVMRAQTNSSSIALRNAFVDFATNVHEQTKQEDVMTAIRLASKNLLVPPTLELKKYVSQPMVEKIGLLGAWVSQLWPPFAGALPQLHDMFSTSEVIPLKDSTSSKLFDHLWSKAGDSICEVMPEIGDIRS